MESGRGDAWFKFFASSKVRMWRPHPSEDAVLRGRPLAIPGVSNHTETVSLSKETTQNGQLPAQARINISAPWER